VCDVPSSSSSSFFSLLVLLNFYLFLKKKKLMLSTFRKGRNLNLRFLLDETIESKRIKLKQL